MQWEAEQTKPTCAADGFSNIGAADYGGQPLWPQQQQQQMQQQQQQQPQMQQQQMQQQQQQMQQQQMQQQQQQQQQQQHQQQQQQQQQPPPPAYAVASAPPDYPGGPYPGGPYPGALHYGAPAYYADAPGAAGFAHPVASQNVQLNMINAAAAPPGPPVIFTQMAPLVLAPQSYLGWSIFNCLCCFWPLGLAAIIYSVKVDNARNRDEAMRHSLTARNLNIASTTLAPILAIIIVGAVLGSAATAFNRQSSYMAPAYNSYGYTYYYSYLMYYTYFGTYSYTAYSYDWLAGSYSYTATGYTTLTASKYAIDSYYQYRSDSYYYG